MNKEAVNPNGRPGAFPFSPGMKAGPYIFVSGQVGTLNDRGEKLIGVEAQTRQCIENVEKVLAACGASLDDVVKVTVFLANAADFAKMNETYRSYFREDFPARSTAITGLVHPSMLLEIECVAYKP